MLKNRNYFKGEMQGFAGWLWVIAGVDLFRIRKASSFCLTALRHLQAKLLADMDISKQFLSQ
jgi:hypothetical protein